MLLNSTYMLLIKVLSLPPHGFLTLAEEIK